MAKLRKVVYGVRGVTMNFINDIVVCRPFAK
jgi:hypothetical protein